MSFSLKTLPALALAIALFPLAAQPHSADAAPQTVYFSEMMPSSATIDNPTTMHGGVSANSFRESFGG
jgi:hypothetical protein